MNAIKELINAAGGQSKLALLANVTPGAVHQWAIGATSPSPESAVAMERALGVPCERIRADLDFHRFRTKREAAQYGCKKGDVKGYLTLCCALLADRQGKRR